MQGLATVSNKAIPIVSIADPPTATPITRGQHIAVLPPYQAGAKRWLVATIIIVCRWGIAENISGDRLDCEGPERQIVERR